MHIGMMADLYHPHVSGVTHAIDLQRRALLAAGHQVSVFHFSQGLRNTRPGTFPTDAIWLPLTASGIPIARRLSLRARRQLSRVDVLHLHHPFMSAALALPAAAADGVPVIFSHHTRYDRYAECYLPAPLARLAVRWWRGHLRRLSQSLAAVIAPSRQLLRELRKLQLDCPVIHIPNGVDCGYFSRGERDIWRARLGLADEQILLLYAGRLGPEKNLVLLLRAFAMAVAQEDRLQLALAGSGTQTPKLRRLIHKMGLTSQVQLLGAIPYRQMPQLLAAVEAVVTASTTEVMPLTLLEAMSAGKPIVALRAPGASELIDDNLSGLLAEPEAASLGAAMAEIGHSGTARRRMAERARQVGAAFDIHALVAQWLQLYRSVSAARERAELPALHLTGEHLGGRQ